MVLDDRRQRRWQKKDEDTDLEDVSPRKNKGPLQQVEDRYPPNP